MGKRHSRGPCHGYSWKEEADSLTEPLWCYAISAKRYCLYRLGEDGRLLIVGARDQPEEVGDDASAQADQGLEDWSEHGLGLFLDPTAQDQDRPRRDKQGRRIWVRQAWQWILNDALDKGDPMPKWANTFALTRFTVSGPRTANWFASYNRAQRSRADWIAPGGFGLIAHVHPNFAERTTALPTGPYESDPAKWPALAWYDRRTGEPAHVLTAADRSDPDRFTNASLRGDPVINTLADILARYRDRTEHKSRGPDTQPATSDTGGLLQRRPVESHPTLTELIGKEGNQLAERLSAELTDPASYRNDYGPRADRWETLVLPVLREIGAFDLGDRTGLAAASVYRVLNGTRPHPANRRRYEQAAVNHADRGLTTWSVATPHDPSAALCRYLQERARRGEDVSSVPMVRPAHASESASRRPIRQRREPAGRQTCARRRSAARRLAAANQRGSAVLVYSDVDRRPRRPPATTTHEEPPTPYPSWSRAPSSLMSSGVPK